MLLGSNTLLGADTLLGLNLAGPVFDTPDLFGPITGNPVIEDAVTSTLVTWLPTYLWGIERRFGLRKNTIPHPPTPESVRAVIDPDFEDWGQDECPCVFVTVNPTGGTERNGAGYGSWFELVVGAIVFDQPHRIAGYYGMAVAACIAQNGSLGGLATRTELVEAPVTEYPDPTKRVIVRSRTTFHTFIDGLADDQSGPSVPLPTDSPHAPDTPGGPWTDWPTVTSTPVTLVTELP